jgi:pyrimidine-nucleoside phosphorylase
VGNALEVKEAIDILAGRAKGPLLHVSLVLGSHMLVAAGCASALAEAEAMLAGALANGAGLNMLREMIAAQGGDASVCDNVSLLPKAPVIRPVSAKESGFVQCMDTTQLGICAQHMGAGRVRKEDVIDPSVGFVLHKRIGDRIEKGEPLVTVHAKDEASFRIAEETLLEKITIGQEHVQPEPLIHAVVTKGGVEYPSLLYTR